MLCTGFFVLLVLADAWESMLLQFVVENANNGGCYVFNVHPGVLKLLSM